MDRKQLEVVFRGKLYKEQHFELRSLSEVPYTGHDSLPWWLKNSAQRAEHLARQKELALKRRHDKQRNDAQSAYMAEVHVTPARFTKDI